MSKSAKRSKTMSQKRAAKEQRMRGEGTSPYAQKHKQQAGGTFRATSPFCNPDREETPLKISRSRWDLAKFLFDHHMEAMKPRTTRAPQARDGNYA